MRNSNLKVSKVYNTGGFKITELELQIKNLSTEFECYQAIQLSDLHLGAYTSPDLIDKAIDISMSLKPNIFLLTGDYVHVGRKEVRELLFKAFGPEVSRFRHYRRLARHAAISLSEKLERLEAPDGILGIWGNHDYLEGIRTLKKYLPRSIKWLRNDVHLIKRGHTSLIISGIDDFRYGDPNLAKMKNSINETEKQVTNSDITLSSAVKIILSHNPDSVLLPDSELLKEYDLMLSGHTHGGQICLPGSIPVKSETKQKKFRSSLCHFGKLPIYISNGIGCSGIPLRLFCPPEIVVVRLTCINNCQKINR
ncbi:MAG TPA: metallophosphoesterase [Oligoflexia bacterium]|nr:metallophosphoesterase [Oligoflexia bacterium]HMP48064.1 metallophosphoesterase [Oligoflexia bacterium]